MTKSAITVIRAGLAKPPNRRTGSSRMAPAASVRGTAWKKTSSTHTTASDTTSMGARSIANVANAPMTTANVTHMWKPGSITAMAVSFVSAR